VFIGVASYSIYLSHELAVYYAEQAGYAPVLAGIGGIVLGIGFWYALERPLTAAQTRERLTGALTGTLRKAFRITGIPESIGLAAKHLPSRVERDLLEPLLRQEIRTAQR
jgi:peptidoglycan/LPS O-acetylase OafA/YrhL